MLSCFKLNPFEYLNLPFDSSPEDVKKQYRKFSLLVHPDKRKHPQAKGEFGALAKAQQLLLDAQERDCILSQVQAAKVKWRKQIKKDTASKIKSLVDEKFEEYYERTEEFKQQLKLKISEEEGRLKKDEEEQKETWKQKHEHKE